MGANTLRAKSVMRSRMFFQAINPFANDIHLNREYAPGEAYVSIRPMKNKDFFGVRLLVRDPALAAKRLVGRVN